MAVLQSKTFLSTLIETGPDASLNLFAVNFKPFGSSNYDNELSCRTTDFPMTTRDLSTVDLSYQNVKISKIAAGSAIPKTIQFSIRLDSNYKLLNTLRQNMCIDENGNFIEDESKQYTITVDTLKPAVKLQTHMDYESAYRWVFNNCYITGISSVAYSYESSGGASSNITFVWGTYNEGLVANSQLSSVKEDSFDSVKKFYNDFSLLKVK